MPKRYVFPDEYFPDLTLNIEKSQYDTLSVDAEFSDEEIARIEAARKEYDACQFLMADRIKHLKPSWL